MLIMSCTRSCLADLLVAIACGELTLSEKNNIYLVVY